MTYYSPLTPRMMPAPPILGISLPWTSSKSLKASGQFSNRTAKGLSTLAQLRTDIELQGLYFGDIALDDCGGVMASFIGALTDTTLERISSPNGRYFPSVIAGIFRSVNTRLTNLTIRDCTYIRATPVTSPNNQYGCINLDGKTDNDTGSGFLFENIHAENLWVDYDPVKYPKNPYPNSDFIVIEECYENGNVRNCSCKGVADAGYDLKGRGWRRDLCTGEDCRETFKTWHDTYDGQLFSIKPRTAHFVVTSFDGTPTRHVMDFAPIRADEDPNIPVYQFLHNPGGEARCLSPSPYPPGQIIATKDSGSAGAKVFLGGGSDPLPWDGNIIRAAA